VDETHAFFDPFGLRFDPIGSDRALDARFEGEPARPHGVLLLPDVNR
jgi:hypothetical protein